MNEPMSREECQKTRHDLRTEVTSTIKDIEKVVEKKLYRSTFFWACTIIGLVMSAAFGVGGTILGYQNGKLDVLQNKMFEEIQTMSVDISVIKTKVEFLTQSDD